MPYAPASGKPRPGGGGGRYGATPRIFPQSGMGPAQIQDLNIGIVALAVNFTVLILVSLATRRVAMPARAAAE
jgi:hypothetical protein